MSDNVRSLFGLSRGDQIPDTPEPKGFPDSNLVS